MLIRYSIDMFITPKSLPSDPAELRVAAEGLVELAKSQALQIEKLKHQLAGRQRHRFGSKSESADQLNLELKLEEEETAAARIAPPEKASAQGSEALRFFSGESCVLSNLSVFDVDTLSNKSGVLPALRVRRLMNIAKKGFNTVRIKRSTTIYVSRSPNTSPQRSI